MKSITHRLSLWAIAVAAVLLIPLLAQWPWIWSDYVFGAVMLFGAAFIYEFSTRNVTNIRTKRIVGGVVFLILAFLWVFAATGFGM